MNLRQLKKTTWARYFRIKSENTFTLLSCSWVQMGWGIEASISRSNFSTSLSVATVAVLPAAKWSFVDCFRVPIWCWLSSTFSPDAEGVSVFPFAAAMWGEVSRRRIGGRAPFAAIEGWASWRNIRRWPHKARFFTEFIQTILAFLSLRGFLSVLSTKKRTDNFGGFLLQSLEDFLHLALWYSWLEKKFRQPKNNADRKRGSLLDFKLLSNQNDLLKCPVSFS